MAVTTTSLAVNDGAGARQTFATMTDPAGLQRSAVSLDTPGVAAYRFSASFTPQPTAAVTLFTVTGSSTKTIRVKRILVGGVSTANATVPAQLIRSTALGAGGTTVSPTQAKLDSGTLASATAVVSHYTSTLKAAGTSTSIGPLWSGRLYTAVVTTPTVAPSMQEIFPGTGSLSGQAIVLRGTADFIEFQNTNASNLSAGTIVDYFVELEEDAS